MALPTSRHIRVRLRFDEPPLGYPRMLLYLVNLENCRVVSDLESQIKTRFTMSRYTHVHLYVDDYLLPANEKIEIVRDNDVIRVQQEYISKELVTNSARTKKKKKKSKHINHVESEELEFFDLELHHDDYRKVKRKLKKHKAHKTHVEQKRRRLNSTDDEPGEERSEKKIASTDEIINSIEDAKKHKANKKMKNKKKIDSDNGVLSKSESERTNVENTEQQSTQKIKTVQTSTATKNSKSPKKFVRVKKNNTASSNNHLRFESASESESTSGDQNDSSVDAKHINDAVGAEKREPHFISLCKPTKLALQGNTKTNTKTSSKNSSDLSESTSTSNACSDSSDSDSDNEIATNSTSSNLHKIALENEINGTADDRSPQVVHNGIHSPIERSTSRGRKRPNRRRRTQQMYELDKEAQLNTVLTNRSIIIQNAPDSSPMTSIQTQKPARDYNSLTPLHGPPRTGDKIAYKILELSSSYNPEISEFKEGLVTLYDPVLQSLEIDLTYDPSSVSKKRAGKFDLVYDDHDDDDDLSMNAFDVNEDSGKVSVTWTSLIEPKLMPATP
ncbi:uncharacterized protein LOC100370740 isoform X2 [Saccoglossus kowalevskii]|uniref:Coilin-like isoform X1 n=1 Tax=Saccoglossus kowalevskii TaxID=10224 RepID=A0ABM0GZL5_SACKO|nr:PREDICTED: coilin-like isoform X1 [Saccoglossus kowalevskii]